jgi:hypothetical protein
MGEGQAGFGYYRGCYPGLVLDYYGTALVPDGPVWVGFAPECHCGQSTGNPNCPSEGTGGLFGLVGRLVPRGKDMSAQH